MNPGFKPRHQRLLVAAFALNLSETDDEAIPAMKRAWALYEKHDPFQLDADFCAGSDYRRYKLTIPGILAELDALVIQG